MRFAYVNTDPLENPEVLNDLKLRLVAANITMVTTDKPWQEIYHPCPFLYFRNAYLRFDNEGQILDFHIAHPHIPFIQTANRELISFSPHTQEVNSFVIRSATYYMRPSIEPLPILIGTHCRPVYFQLTINSLYNSFRDDRQRIYIVGSQPDAETLQIIEKTLATHSNAEAVLSNENLKYSFANFGSKFFNLERFIHFEDDGILPDHITYNLPFWGSQLAHRASTADIVAMRVYEGNWASEMYTCGILNNKPLYKFKDHLWHYFKKKEADRYTIPLGGLGFVIKTASMYKNFDPSMYATSDRLMFQEAKSLCMLNMPIYHIGANQKMDYPGYNLKKVSAQVERYQKGVNMRTKEEKPIDLAVDWSNR
jgi:hypothetical protein